jgi:hypothetical protein
MSSDNSSARGDRLTKIDFTIDWEAFRPITKAIYRNDTENDRVSLLLN